MTPAPPPFPEAALRAVLAGTVAAWAASPPATLDVPSAGDEPRRLYLDAFAGAEFQFGTGVARGADEETRAAAALRALEQAGPAPPPVAVFAEEDPAHLGRIYAELEESAGERLRATGDLASLASGEVSLLEMPFAGAAVDVARFAAGARTFALVAPPAARALPWSALRAIAALPDATLLVRLPHSDFEKQSRHNSPLADLPGFVRRIVEGCSAMLDDPRHAWLPAWRAEAAARGPSAALAGVMERLRALLDGVAGRRILKSMELEAKDGARTWLLLLTPDPAIALAANAAVRAAKVVDRAAAASPLDAAEKAPGKAAGKAPAAKTRSAPAANAPEPSATPPDLGPGSSAAAADAKPSRKKSRRAPASPAPSVEAASDTGDPGAVDANPADTDASNAAAPPDSDADSAAETPPAPQAAPPSSATEPEPPTPPTPPTPPASQARKAAPPPPVAEVLDLFGEQLAPVETPEFVLPDPAVLAASVETRFAGSTATWREILHAFAATDATPTELKAALAVLRRGGRATFKALKTDDDAVTFPTEPIVREKPKRAKKAAKDDGGFFGNAEGSGDTEELEGADGSDGG